VRAGVSQPRLCPFAVVGRQSRRSPPLLLSLIRRQAPHPPLAEVAVRARSAAGAPLWRARGVRGWLSVGELLKNTVVLFRQLRLSRPPSSVFASPICVSQRVPPDGLFQKEHMASPALIQRWCSAGGLA